MTVVLTTSGREEAIEIPIVGDTAFSHAGVLADWVTQVEGVNRGARCWLDGQAGGPDGWSPR